jgi:DNA helicase-2/ATP-dependent DNA helicase PcrA
VLTRTHAQLVLLEESLRGAGIPYRLRGATAFLERPEVRQAVGGLRRLPAAGLLSTALPDLRQMAGGPDGGGPPVDDGAAADPVAERRAHLEELVRLAEEQLGLDPAASVGGFLAWLTTALRSGDAGHGTDAVELATFHAAKGLEWPVVFLGGLEQGLVPVGQADTPEARAEERRLLYVAVTRAQRELHCSWAERRTFGARTASRTPSPWLATIEAVVAALSEGREAGDWRRHLDQSRTQVRAAAGGRQARPAAVLGEGADPGVMAALRSWRAGAAKAAGVPAFVVFHDSTLAAVAEARPRDRTALLALPGLGPVKAERYGEALLAVVADAAAARAG